MNQEFKIVQTTPNELATLISENVKTQLQEFSKSFTSSDPEVLLTRDETCKLLQINSSTLWSYTKQSKLTAYGLGNRIWYKKSEILNALQPLKK